MGLFDIFRKSKGSENSTTENGVIGPTFFEGLTEHLENPKRLHSHEWRRKLKTSSGQTKFKIKFYGKRNGSLIIGTDFAPSLVFAVDNLTGVEILLFDGCKHGYNAIFCDTYSSEQINNRTSTQFYKDKDGSETFEIILSTYNNFNFEEEFGEDVDKEGFIKLPDDSKMKFEDAKRNGFDTLQIWAINDKGEIIDVISEELA